MLKINKKSSKKHGPSSMLAYTIYEDFELSKLIPIDAQYYSQYIYIYIFLKRDNTQKLLMNSFGNKYFLLFKM